MMQGRYNGSYFVGVMPDGTLGWFCTDEDYFEAYQDALDDGDSS